MAFKMEHDVFAIRDREQVRLLQDKPDAGRYLAVMARSVQMPPGARSPVRVCDGAPVEQAAILAALWIYKYQCWAWTYLSPPTKEWIGDLMFSVPVDRDRWYYLEVSEVDEPAVTVNTRDCEPMTAEAQQAIDSVAADIRDAMTGPPASNL